MNPVLAVLFLASIPPLHAWLAAATSSPASRVADENRFLDYRVVSETPETLVLELDYEYSGDHGPTAYVQAKPAESDRKVSASHMPGQIKPGLGTVRVAVRVSRRSEPIETSQLRLVMYKAGRGPFCSRVVPHHKVWSRPAETQPARQLSSSKGVPDSQPAATRTSRRRPPSPSRVRASVPAGETVRAKMAGARVVTELPDTLVLDVDYEYLNKSNLAGEAFAYAVRNGKALDNCLVQPGEIRPPLGTTRIVISCATRGEILRTSDLEIILRSQGQVLCRQMVRRRKEWSGADSRPAVISAASAPTSSPAFDPTRTRFLDYRIVADLPDHLVVDVDYQYGGEFGPCLLASADALAADQGICGSDGNVNRVTLGRGTVRFLISGCHGGSQSESNQLRFLARPWGERREPCFQAFAPCRKTWSSPSRPVSSRSSPVQSRPAYAEVQRQAAFVRWAIVATPEVEKSGLVDLLTTVLARQRGLQLLERAEIQAATRELAVSQMVGPTAAGGRLKLGRILKADALILLAEETIGQGEERKEMIRVVISETACGARLQLDSLACGSNPVDKLADRIAGLVHEVNERYPSGLRWVVAVPPFVSQNISHEYDPLRARFAHVLESALSTYPGTAVLEMEEVQAIRKELDLAGGDVAGRVVPAFVEGEFQIKRAQGTESVTLNVRITRPSGARALDWSLPSIEKTVELLQHELPVQVMQVPPEEFDKTLSVGKQVELSAARADVFARRGEYLPATALREAAMLVDPNNRRQGITLVDEYMTAAPYRGSLIWSRIPVDVARESFYRRLTLWSRGIEILEVLIRKELIDRDTARILGNATRQAFKDLMDCVRDLADTKNLVYDIDTAEFFSMEKARHTETYRRFVREVVPHMGMLGKDGALRTLHRLDKPIGEDLIDLALDLSCVTPTGPYGVPYTKADLDHYAHVLIDLTEDDVILAQHILDLFHQMGVDPDYPRAFSNEEYLEFLAKLETSGRLVCRFYSRLGYLFYDYQYGRNGRKTSAEETLRALDQWDRDARAYLFVRTDCLSETRHLRKDIERIYRDKGPLPPLPPRVVTLDPNVRNEIHFEPVRIVIHRKSGQSVTFFEYGDWDGIGGQPVGVIAAESLDVFWNRRAIWVQRQPGTLQEIVYEDKEEFWLHDITWDGQCIWAIAARNGVLVYKPDGRVIAQAGPDDGLPPSTVGGKLAPLSLGRIVAVGSLGIRNRAWCANLTLQGSKITVDVFHQAMMARAQAERERIKENDPRVTFVPYRLYNVPASQPAGDRRILLSCGQETALLSATGVNESHVLWLNPEQRKVDMANFELAGNDNLATRHIYHFLGNGDCLLAYGPSIQAWTSPANRDSGAPPVRELYSNKRNSFYGQMFAHSGYIYAPGHQWVRVDSRSLEVEPLGIGNGREVLRSNSLCYGRSRHLGLIAWEELGQQRLYQITVRPVQVVPETAHKNRIAEFDRIIVSNPKSDLPYRRKVLYLLYDDRPEEAKAACLSWIEAFPTSREARLALGDTLRQMRSGIHPGEWDDLWQNYPHPTFASRGMFGVIDLKVAERLPFAADATEWYVAEVYALCAVLSSYWSGNYRTTIKSCNLWENACESHDGVNDMSYLTLRAAARLRLGEYEAAQADAEAALKHEAAGRLWAGKVKELLTAIRARNRDYEYNTRELEPDHGWYLRTP